MIVQVFVRTPAGSGFHGNQHIALATYAGRHICVDLLWEALKPANRRRLDVLAMVVTAMFLAALAAMSWVKVIESGSQVTSDLRLHMSWLYAPASLGATVGALLAIAAAWNLARGRRSDGTEETAV